ncbi:MAG: Na+/H+ antiporter subunit E [Spirochaetes bacterium]|nr:Na+/H+ antiporter subunit E [Spirochaetota bacterium]
MGRYGFFVLLALAAVWIILVESLSWQSLAFGLLLGAFCTYFSDMFLPPIEAARTINIKKLFFFPLYVIWQVYSAGFQMLKFVIVGGKFAFINVRTNLKSETLRVLLMDSITFVPGSISVDMHDDTIMTLCMYDKKLDADDPKHRAAFYDWIVSGMEDYLARAEIEEKAVGYTDDYDDNDEEVS